MEKEIRKNVEKQDAGSSEKNITRKQAIKKAGLMAASAATMMVMLSNNAKAMGQSKDGFEPACYDPKTSCGYQKPGAGNNPRPPRPGNNPRPPHPGNPGR